MYRYLYTHLSISISIYLFLYLSLFIYLYLYLYIYTILYLHIDFSPIICKYIKEEKKEPTLTGKKQGKIGEFRNSPSLKEENNY